MRNIAYKDSQYAQTRAAKYGALFMATRFRDQQDMLNRLAGVNTVQDLDCYLARDRCFQPGEDHNDWRDAVTAAWDVLVRAYDRSNNQPISHGAFLVAVP